VGVNYPFFVASSLFWKVGGADEKFPGPYHDPDLFHRFKLADAELVRTPFVAPYHFSGLSLRHAESKTKKSLRWIELENVARLVFVRKWGVKPKSKFGKIPEVKASQLWEQKHKTTFDKTRFWFLLRWEVLRGRWRYWVHSIWK
jgi:hypothetical protein